MNLLRSAKYLLPAGPVPVRVLFGPFRGARIVLSPRSSLRKIAGIYERELNAWIETALGSVRRVIDVGANDGYFSIGCAAAFHRLRRCGSVVAFEPSAHLVAQLRRSVALLRSPAAPVEIVGASVGRESKLGTTSLDALSAADRRSTLIKIDVEGAELEVIAGASSWFDPSNRFLIEVHEERFVSELRGIFAARGLALRLIHQRPLPILGAELRERENCWLVSSENGAER